MGLEVSAESALAAGGCNGNNDYSFYFKFK